MALTKKQKSLIAQKAARTRKLNAIQKDKAKLATRRKRKKSMSKGFTMKDIVDPRVFRESLNNNIQSGVGGGIAALAEEMLKGKINPKYEGWDLMALGMVSTAILQAPKTGGGLFAVGAYKVVRRFINRNQPVNDNRTYLRDNKYVNNIEALPEVLDPQGKPLNDEGVMYLQDDAGNMYLQDDAGNMYLQDQNGQYQVAYAPNFGG